MNPSRKQWVAYLEKMLFQNKQPSYINSEDKKNQNKWFHFLYCLSLFILGILTSRFLKITVNLHCYILENFKKRIFQFDSDYNGIEYLFVSIIDIIMPNLRFQRILVKIKREKAARPLPIASSHLCPGISIVLAQEVINKYLLNIS